MYVYIPKYIVWAVCSFPVVVCAVAWWAVSTYGRVVGWDKETNNV